ncbi:MULTISPECIES: hypothetical protein [unclassified Bradyrhizobium]|uniref:nucleotide-binding protein n=2 Tax=Bradyrhizobium TaxID=374 RepID=UPI0028E7E4E0|nr:MULTISPECIES: hypothetical protein [unclassified Bradyrhizobium]
MPKPFTIFVGAQKGGVGKTTSSIALMDYFAQRGMPARGWDTEMPKGNLIRFQRPRTQVVDLSTSDGQMEVFDSLQQTPVSLIDMKAGILADTVQLIHDLGCVRLAEQGLMRLALFHVIGSSVASIEEIAETAKALGDAVRHYVVINHHTNDASFFANMPDVSKDALNGSAVIVNIPKLNTRAMEFVDANTRKAGVPDQAKSFTGFGADENNSFTMRGYVNSWTEKVFAELDAARLTTRD